MWEILRWYFELFWRWYFEKHSKAFEKMLGCERKSKRKTFENSKGVKKFEWRFVEMWKWGTKRTGNKITYESTRLRHSFKIRFDLEYLDQVTIAVKLRNLVQIKI